MVFNWYLTKAPRSYYKLVHFVNFTWRERSIHSLLAVFIDYSLHARSNQSILKEISCKYSLEGLMLNWNSNTLATWCEELTHVKRPWCWERLKLGGEGDDKGWDGWMASLIQWTWVWANSGSWWWTGRPDVLQSMGSQKVGHDWATELNWSELTEIQTPMFWLRNLYSQRLCRAVNM